MPNSTIRESEILKKGLVDMKKIIMIFSLMFVIGFTTEVFAHDYDREDAGHPLCLVSYVIRPIGVGLEKYIFRPLHKFVSKPKNADLFGHEPHKSDKY